MQSCTRIDDDGTRWLLSDYAGVLYLLVVAHAEQGVTGLKVQVLGEWHLATGVPCMWLKPVIIVRYWCVWTCHVPAHMVTHPPGAECLHP